MTSERDEYFYHEQIVHPALTTAKQIRNVLIIGGGDGGTAREVLRHPEVESVTLVEIDKMVIDTSKEFLPFIGKDAWKNPKLKVLVADAIKYVEEAPANTFDIILLDGSDPVGPAEGLYHSDFYENCRKTLKEDGIFAVQSESPFLMYESFLKVQKGLPLHFKQVHPYFGPVPLYNSGTWSWTLAGNQIDPSAIIDTRIKAIEEDCKYYNRQIHLGAFSMPNYVKKLLTE